jgi:hypothetical protein
MNSWFFPKSQYPLHWSVKVQLLPGCLIMSKVKLFVSNRPPDKNKIHLCFGVFAVIRATGELRIVKLVEILSMF